MRVVAYKSGFDNCRIIQKLLDSKFLGRTTQVFQFNKILKCYFYKDKLWILNITLWFKIHHYDLLFLNS